MKQNKFFIYIASSFIILSVNLYSLTYTISTYSENVFYKSLNITKTNTFIINNRVHMPTYNNSLFLDFDNSVLDRTGNYIVNISPDIKYGDGVNGGSSILFPQKSSKVMINRDVLNLNEHMKTEGSFTIEFYLKPYRENVNTVVMDSYFMYKENGEFKRKSINASIIGGKIVWTFKNFFTYGEAVLDVIIDEGSYLKTGEWGYHSISFDAATGKLVKYLNGMEEGVLYITTTGNANGGIYVPSLSETINSYLYLGGGFIGAIDNFNILHDYKRNYDLNKYNDSGEIVSTVIDLESNIAYLENINMNESNTNGTDIMLFYRSSDKYFLPDDTRILWSYIGNNFDFGYEHAQYVQVKAILSSDATKNYTPIMKSINIVYDIPSKPNIPSNLQVVPTDGSVTLSWDDTHDESIAGYKIYYSTKPGIYNEFNNVPIIIGANSSYKVDNLDNETLYYFKISAFSVLSENNESDFSKEVFSRPKRILK